MAMKIYYCIEHFTIVSVDYGNLILIDVINWEINLNAILIFLGFVYEFEVDFF